MDLFYNDVNFFCVVIVWVKNVLQFRHAHLCEVENIGDTDWRVNIYNFCQVFVYKN